MAASQGGLRWRPLSACLPGWRGWEQIAAILHDKYSVTPNIVICGTVPFLLSVLRIHDILVWIWIRGSMPLSNGSGSCYFRH
jgi:hypothetical protein